MHLKKFRVNSYRMKFSVNSSYNTSFDDLPDELLSDILLRLPVKTLIQSTCVNKLWFSIIKRSSFVSSYLSHSISHPSGYYFYFFGCGSTGPVMSDNHILTRYPNYMFPFEPNSMQTFIGSCNGLICVSSQVIISVYEIYMINPFIHKYKKLGDKPSCYVDWISKFHPENIDTKFGFGYSDLENDYKVVRIFNRYPDICRKIGVRYDDYRIRVLESKVEIYSLKSDKWRALDVSLEIYSFYSPIFVQGCLYWSMRHLPTWDEYLLCFDLNDEVVSRIEYPTNYFQSDCKFSLVTKNDTFVAVKFDDSRIHLCVMEKIFDENVRWNKFYYECPSFGRTSRCLGFSSVGRLIFLEEDFDLETDTVVAVDLDNSCAIEKQLVVDYYGIVGGSNVLESLALLLD